VFRREFRRASAHRPRRGSHGIALLIAVALAASAWLGLRPGGRQIVGDVAVVDGDSLRMGEMSIRLKGLDAPELKQSCTRAGVAYPCGRVAREALLKLVAGRKPRCRVQGRDRYGRSLAQCFVDGSDVGATLVESGYAVGYGGYEREEARARSRSAGVWAGEFERPSVWRRLERP
jgi:endonuclease YncB( thermonuclease family)